MHMQLLSIFWKVNNIPPQTHDDQSVFAWLLRNRDINLIYVIRVLRTSNPFFKLALTYGIGWVDSGNVYIQTGQYIYTFPHPPTLPLTWAK